MLEKKEIPSQGLAASGDGNQLSGEQIIRARTTLKREKQWRSDPEQKKLFESQIEGIAVYEMNHQRPFAMQTLIEKLRWKDHVNAEGKRVRISNSFAPIWSRLLIQKFPEMANYLELRPSVFDQVKPSW